MRHPTVRLAWLLILSVSAVAEAQPGNEPESPPNVVLIVGDDHAGGTLGVDGDPRQATPHLDALARQGVRFDRAYCNSPLCTASRASFITGRMPHAVGVTQLTTPLPESTVTLGDWFGQRGYDTAALGKMHFNSKLKHGFNLRLDTGDWIADLRARHPEIFAHLKPFRPFVDPAHIWLNAAVEPVQLPADDMESSFIADRAIEFLKRRRTTGADQGEGRKTDPFLLVVSFQEPHSPFRFPRDWSRRSTPDQFDVPPVSETDLFEQPQVFSGLTDDQKRGIMASYYTSLSFMDEQVGRVVSSIDDFGLSRKTIIVYLGDNGYSLGQHGRFEKHCGYEPAIRVPLLVRWTDHLKADQAVSELVEFVDLFPTLTELAHQPNPPDLQGQSLVPLLRGDADAKGRPFIVSQYTENEEAVVRTSQYKLIVGTGRRQRQDGYTTGRPLAGPYEHLFDVRADPGESNDLISDPAHLLTRDRLRHALYNRLSSTRPAVPPIPHGLSELEAIHWCLVPRDHPVAGQ